LEEDCEPRLIYLGFLSTVVQHILAHGAAFWILIGRSLLIRDRELVSNDIFLGRVGVFSDGLGAVECLSKYVIRSRHLLGGVSFGYVQWCSAYIQAPFVL
jgi:hypothetical protein